MSDDHASMSWEEIRQRGLTDLAAVIEQIWGARCNRHDGNCFPCQAWTIFDCMERLTETGVLEAYDERREKQRHAAERQMDIDHRRKAS